jgi:hypothetical protein
MSTTNISKQYAQGDILFVRKEKYDDLMLARRKRVLPTNGKLVIARGEKTGHSHAIDVSAPESRVSLYSELFGEQVLIVDEENGIDVIHEDHQTLHLDPGRYVAIQQRHYTPKKSISRAVFD